MTNQSQCSICWLPINPMQVIHYDGLCPDCYKYEKATIQNRLTDDQELIEATDKMFDEMISAIKSKL